MTNHPLNPRRPKLTLKAVPAALLGCSLAQAAGFQLLEQNASGIGTAYAGSAAVADNASTIYFNPAGMTELRDREISLGGSLIDLSAKFKDRGSITGPGSTLVGNGGDAGSTALVPNAYLSWKLNPQLWAGLGISAPFGLKTEYGPQWVGAAQALHFDVKTININPSLAFKVNETLSLGAGLNYQKLDADYLRNVSTLGSPPSPLPLSTSTVSFRADDWSLGWNVGVLFKPQADTKVGFSYRSRIHHTVGGTLRTAGAGGPALTAIGDSGAKARITLPDTAILSMAHRMSPQWEMLGDVSWTNWSVIRTVDIVRTTSVQLPGVDSSRLAGGTAQRLDAEFRDSWRFALGANYRWSDAWTFKGGIAFDRTPVRGPTTTLVSLPDANRTWLTVGAQWRLDADKRVDFGLAHIFVKDTDIDNDQRAPTIPVGAPTRGRVTGTYDSKLWLLGVQYSQAF